MERLKNTSTSEGSGVPTASKKLYGFIKKNALTIVITCVWFIFGICVAPIIKHHIEVTKIKNEIEKVQLQIELNKEQRNSCYSNMELWHNENEDNRKILNDLMKEYNELVGFTKASATDEISIRVSPTEQVDLTGTISDT